MSFDVGNRAEGAGGDDPGIDWDARAAAFDDEPDHGLRDPSVRAAWADRLALLAAEQGHRVTAVDLSPRMVTRARAKLTAHDARVLVGIPAPDLIRSLTPLVPHTHTERLSGDAWLWGRPVDDERYVVVGTTAP